MTAHPQLRWRKACHHPQKDLADSPADPAIVPPWPACVRCSANWGGSTAYDSRCLHRSGATLSAMRAADAVEAIAVESVPAVRVAQEDDVMAAQARCPQWWGVFSARGKTGIYEVRSITCCAARAAVTALRPCTTAPQLAVNTSRAC